MLHNFFLLGGIILITFYQVCLANVGADQAKTLAEDQTTRFHASCDYAEKCTGWRKLLMRDSFVCMVKAKVVWQNGIGRSMASTNKEIARIWKIIMINSSR